MRGRDFADLKAFMAIVTHGSFARAAAHLRVSPSALSQTIRGLEERLAVRLLDRTTRSVAPTDAGARLIERLAPAVSELEAAILETTSTSDRVAGLLRITMPRAGASLIGPVLGRFHRAHPDVVLDITCEDAPTDIVKSRCDAGIRIGERLEKDMHAIRLGGDLGLMAVATPAYFTQYGVPKHPRELHRHRCINIRMPTDGSLYRWEFERGKETLEISVEGPLIVNDTETALYAALDGAGLAYLFDRRVLEHIERRRLQRVLQPWSPPFEGLYLYYPIRRQMPATLRAFIDVLRSEGIAKRR